MKKIIISIACAITFVSITALAADDPEMDKIDMSPEARMEPRPGIDKALLVEVTATVTGVDIENRQVTIEGPEGNSTIIHVTDQVKNLPQVKIGDRVEIMYYRSAVVDLVTKKEDVELGTELTAARASAPAGNKPAGAFGTEVKRTGEILFVDPYQKFIRFRSPDTGIRTVTLENRPDLQHYLDELKKGDIVQVTYTEALAISLRPAKQ
jgi:hypothetical protein